MKCFWNAKLRSISFIMKILHSRPTTVRRFQLFLTYRHQKCRLNLLHEETIWLLGQKYAVMEEKVVLCHLVRNFKIESVDDEKFMDENLTYAMVLRPTKGVRVVLSPRSWWPLHYFIYVVRYFIHIQNSWENAWVKWNMLTLFHTHEATKKFLALKNKKFRNKHHIYLFAAKWKTRQM